MTSINRCQNPMYKLTARDRLTAIVKLAYYHSLRATQGNAFSIFSTATFGQ